MVTTPSLSQKIPTLELFSNALKINLKLWGLIYTSLGQLEPFITSLPADQFFKSDCMSCCHCIDIQNEDGSHYALFQTQECPHGDTLTPHQIGIMALLHCESYVRSDK